MRVEPGDGAAVKVLVTGGLGHIGSHTALALSAAGHEPVLLDNLWNAAPRTLGALRALAGRQLAFVEGDVRDAALLDRLLRGGAFSAVVHLAGLKGAAAAFGGAAVQHDVNVAGTACLAGRMSAWGVRTLVFGSSAAVYGAASAPLHEDAPTAPATPYGRSKLAAERLLREAQASEPGWRIAVLRCFNAAGAHPSGRLGEDPAGAPDSLLGRLGRTALGLRGEVAVFGGDWPTPDGTCVRDYVHVVDVARAYVLAAERAGRVAGVAVFNVGAGRGGSVLEALRAYERASGRTIPHRIAGRRAGDVAVACAEPSRIRGELGWRATRGIGRICADDWRWQSFRAPRAARGCG